MVLHSLVFLPFLSLLSRHEPSSLVLPQAPFSYRSKNKTTAAATTKRPIEHRKSKKRRTQTQYFLFLSCSSQVICYSNVKLPNADILMVIKYSPCGVSLFHPCCQSRCAGTDVVSTAQEKRHGLLLKDKGLNADSTSTHWVLSCESPSPGISLTSQEAGVLGGDCARRHYEDSPGVELHCFPPLLHQSQNSACSFLLAGV